jgi:hypothetical protein
VFPFALHWIFAVLSSTAESQRSSEYFNTGFWGSFVLGFGRAGFFSVPFATIVSGVKEILSGIVLVRTFLFGTLSFTTRAFTTRAFSAGAFTARSVLACDIADWATVVCSFAA